MLCSPFDPVTEEEIRFALGLRKQGREVYLLCTEEGILPKQQREHLLAMAIRPWRHLHIASSAEGCEMIHDDCLITNEEKARNGLFRLAAPGIRGELFRKGWYMECVTAAMCKKSRAIHSVGVAETAVKLARVHHLNEIDAYVMGMLHDITKRMPDEEGARIIARYKPEWNDISPKVWHSYTAVRFMKDEMCCGNSKLLHAVEHHTIGDGHTDYDHILYIADKIEPGRNYDTTEQMKLSCRNLAAGAHLIREESRKYIYEKEGVHV